MWDQLLKYRQHLRSRRPNTKETPADVCKIFNFMTQTFSEFRQENRKFKVLLQNLIAR